MHADANAVKLNDFVATMLAHPRRWALPLLVVVIVALCYALFKGPQWEAVQSLLVRNEATSGGSQLGKFNGLDDMKNAQETVMEIAKSRNVIGAALANVRRASSPGVFIEPTSREIEEAAGKVSLSAPHGIEFGRSEIIRLKYTDSDRQRAIDMNREIGLELNRHLQQLRDRQGESLVAELSEAVDLARADLSEATGRLAQIEIAMGEDLAELRNLSDSSGSGSNLRTRQTHLENELRQAKLMRRDHEQLSAVLIDMQNDPDRLLATPTALLASQPVLQRLKEGLTESQLRTAQLNGSMSDLHPLVIASREAETEIYSRVRGELATAVSGMEMELALQETRIESLQQQLAEVHLRLQRIATQRAAYQNLVLEVRDRNEILQEAQHQLASARGSRAAAHSTSVLTQIDAPSTGSYPEGPRKALIVLAGIIGGLVCGGGVVFITTKAGAADAYLHATHATQSHSIEVNGHTKGMGGNHTAEPSLADLAATIQPKLAAWPERAAIWRETLLRSIRSPSKN